MVAQKLLSRHRVCPVQPTFHPQTTVYSLLLKSFTYDLRGGESIYCLPITEAFVDNGTLTQYFEYSFRLWTQDTDGTGIPSVAPKELGSI